MAYIRPITMVFQEYKKMSVSTQTASLNPCIVGPCYHLMDAEEDPILSGTGAYLQEAVNTRYFPNNIPGAKILLSSCRFYMVNPDLIIAAPTTPNVIVHGAPTTTSHSNNKVTYSEANFPSKVKVGDKAVITNITGGGSVKLTYDYRVIDINPTTRTILLNKQIPVAATALSIDFIRRVEDFYVYPPAPAPSEPEGGEYDPYEPYTPYGPPQEYAADGVYSDPSDNCGFVIPVDPPGKGAISINIDNESFTITAVTFRVAVGEVYPVLAASNVRVTYRALRQDLSDIGTVYSIDEAKARLGKLVPCNPLGYGVMIALANTNSGVKFGGVDTVNIEGFTAIKDRLETVEDVYAIAILSQNPDILGIYKQHVEQMSKPEIGYWRVAIGNTKLEESVKVTDGVGTVADVVIEPGVLSETVLLMDNNGSFITDSVDAGHILYIIDGDGVTHKHIVSSVISEDMLRIVGGTSQFTDDFETNGTTYTYKIMKNLDLTQQAERIGTTSKSYGSSRFINVWPDVIVSEEGKDLPGYYLGCALAGMTGGLAPHQGFTRISIAGVSALKHSNTYFNQTQLDKIAEGGTFIFQQLTPGSVPYVRHQLTTEMSTIEFREFSFVKNFDYVSKVCKDTMDQFLGKWNITPQTLAVLETALRAVMESLKLYTLPRIGSPVLGYDIVSVKQHNDIRDRVEMYCEVDFPYPLNTIGLHIISR